MGERVSTGDDGPTAMERKATGVMAARTLQEAAKAAVQRGQRQDSLTEQMRDLVALAEREGMRDAADWIRARFSFGKYEPALLAEARKERGCG